MWTKTSSENSKEQLSIKENLVNCICETEKIFPYETVVKRILLEQGRTRRVTEKLKARSSKNGYGSRNGQ